MLYLCYLSLAQGTPDYTQGPVRLATHVVIEASNDTEAADVLRKAAAAKRVSKTQYTPTNIQLNSVGKYYPRLISYYDSPQGGHVWGIQPILGGASFYIFTPKQYLDRVSAIHQHFMNLIHEQAAVLESNGSELKLRSDISRDVCAALCAVIAPGFEAPIQQAVFTVAPETIRALEVIFAQDPGIQERIKVWKVEEKQEEKRPEDWSQSCRTRMHEDKADENTVKKQKTERGPAETEQARQSAQTPPSFQSKTSFATFLFVEPEIDADVSDEKKELRHKALKAAHNAHVRSEQEQRLRLQETIWQTYAEMQKQEQLEKRLRFYEFVDAERQKFFNHEEKTYKKMRGNFWEGLWTIQNEESAAKEQTQLKIQQERAAQKAQELQDFEHKKIQKRQAMENCETEPRQKILTEYEDFVALTQEAIKDDITTTDPEKILWPDEWKFPCENLTEDKEEVRKAKQRQWTIWHNKFFAILEKQEWEGIDLKPTYPFLLAIYEENQSKVNKAQTMLYERLDRWSNEIHVLGGHTKQTGIDRTYEILQTDEATVNALPEEQKMPYLMAQRDKLVDYFSKYAATSTNPYRTSLQQRIEGRINQINEAYEYIDMVKKAHLLKILVADSTWQTNTEVKAICQRYGMNVTDFTDFSTFRSAMKKCALKIHPDKTEGKDADAKQFSIDLGKLNALQKSHSW